jgi:uncharacterized protein (TIGR02001 family)
MQSKCGRVRASGRAACVLACLLVASTARAEEELEREEAAPIAGSTFDIAMGVALTTDYVSRGITNTDSSPAIQGYVEPSYRMFYANVWSSNVDYGVGFSGAEIDVGAGIRPVLGPVTFDFGYVHYFYAPQDVSPDYGELYAKATYEVDGMPTFAAATYFAPDYNQTGFSGTYLEGEVSVPLPHDFTLSAAAGYQFFEDDSAFEHFNWNVGVSYAWKKLTLDVRYWDTDLPGNECIVRSGFANGCNARVVATLSFDAPWSEIKQSGQ